MSNTEDNLKLTEVAEVEKPVYLFRTEINTKGTDSINEIKFA